MAAHMKVKGFRRSQGEWRSLLAKFDGGGKSVEAFCRSEAISVASFYRWRNLLRHEVYGDGVVVGE